MCCQNPVFDQLGCHCCEVQPYRSNSERFCKSSPGACSWNRTVIGTGVSNYICPGAVLKLLSKNNLTQKVQFGYDTYAVYTS